MFFDEFNNSKSIIIPSSSSSTKIDSSIDIERIHLKDDEDFKIDNELLNQIDKLLNIVLCNIVFLYSEMTI